MTGAYATIEQWAHHFNSGDSAAVAALYAPNAVLWGTLAREMTTSPEAIGTYFAEAAGLGLTVRLGACAQRDLSETATMIAGSYDLFRTHGGKAIAFPARYSFVLVRRDARWQITHHHSSLRPAAETSFAPA